MELRMLPLTIAGVMLAFAAAPAFGQAGQIACEQDLKRAAELYRQKGAVLSEAERQEANQLMAAAQNKCRSEGAGGLSTRSPEATALIEKLEKAPDPSQAAVPNK